MGVRGRVRILSDAQIDEMARLRERGWGVDRIAEHFTSAGTAISSSSINWQCLRVGADAPPRLRGKSAQPQRSYSRGGHVVQPWTQSDDAQLLKLEADGVGLHLIGSTMGRASSSVRGRLLTLARRQARAEDRAPGGEAI